MTGSEYAEYRVPVAQVLGGSRKKSVDPSHVDFYGAFVMQISNLAITDC